MEAQGHWHDEHQRRRPLFIEWVYFKLFSERARGIVVYGSGWGLPGVIMVQVFPRPAAGEPPAPPVRVVRHDYRQAEIWRSNTSYDCQVGPCAISTGSGGIAIEGEVSDEAHRVSWDLSFSPEHRPVAGFRGPVGVGGLGHIGWDLIAPLARAGGALVVDGEELAVEGAGYVDTNYGRWLFAIDPTTHWNWALGFEASGWSVAGMNIRCQPGLGALIFAAPGKVIRFPTGRGTFRHLQWEPDPRTGVAVPTRSEVHAATPAGDRLALQLASESAFVYEQAIPPREIRGPLPTVFEWGLTESFITVDGELTVADGGRQTLRGAGIQEHPVTRLAWHG